MSKTFDVEQLAVSPTGPEDDGINFMNDIPANEVGVLVVLNVPVMFVSDIL